MSAVNEQVVREYFESLGFLVNQPTKYGVPGRQKRADEEVDLVVVNPQIQETRIPDHLVWTAEDLGSIGRAIVAVRGWHTECFSLSTFENSPDILRFVGPESLEFGSRLLGSGTFAKILCLPRLAASGDVKRKTLEMLKARGVDGIISFRTILLDLVSRADVNRNYDKSDVLQLLRMLKSYDLLKGPQMELFARRRPPAKKKEAHESGPAE